MPSDASFRLPAGELRHRVEIQSATVTQDSVGQPVYSWATVATVWAAIRPMSGQELINAQAVHAQSTHRVVVRSYTGLDESYRFLFGTRVLNIVAVLNILEKGKLMVCTCVEVTT